ncbi:hypothetical protein QE364_000248 [Nocardioides zeae]|uniref:Uncharacterized protein n=1 Tax=Nocardioides zeae TaxID=1457234 RepID=A0ACC6ID89_9ACTN|nr:DUF4350 domain-containing protein [Nocardioides zeae]MDR6175631.1 hypothetical protein [Nocardioides zeae]MDR6208560.1 hypothetical protein [Nocardioides zeae]
MSTTSPAAPPAGAPASGDAAAATTGRRRRRPRLTTVLVLLALVVLLVGGLFLGTEEPGEGRLDPDEAGADGARAVARVLTDQGVDVEVVRDADALADARVDEDTTLFVSDPAALGRQAAEDLANGHGAARLVVADPRRGVPELFGFDDGRRVGATDGVAAGCDDGAAGVDLDGLAIDVDTAVAFEDVAGCFPTDDGVLLAVDGDVLLLGLDEVLTNGQVLEADNAAVALRLLGAEDRLVWYVPDPADISGDEGASLGSFVPDWVVPALWLAALIVVAAMVWRGRRFGPLATEPLPVVVRAIETTESRGRLYRRSGDRQHAARALRDATRERLAQQVGTTRGAPAAAVVHEVARRSGWPVELVGLLLDPAAPVPTDDQQLLQFAHQLRDLEREVRRA